METGTTTSKDQLERGRRFASNPRKSLPASILPKKAGKSRVRMPVGAGVKGGHDTDSPGVIQSTGEPEGAAGPGLIPRIVKLRVPPVPRLWGPGRENRTDCSASTQEIGEHDTNSPALSSRQSAEAIKENSGGTIRGSERVAGIPEIHSFSRAAGSGSGISAIGTKFTIAVRIARASASIGRPFIAARTLSFCFTWGKRLRIGSVAIQVHCTAIMLALISKISTISKTG